MTPDQAGVEKVGRGPFLHLEDQQGAILMDDGLASGFTLIAAVRFLEKKKVRPVIVAIPTPLLFSPQGAAPDGSRTAHIFR